MPRCWGWRAASATKSRTLNVKMTRPKGLNANPQTLQNGGGLASGPAAIADSWEVWVSQTFRQRTNFFGHRPQNELIKRHTLLAGDLFGLLFELLRQAQCVT